jgi:PAS domain S-box-containing protein
MPDDIQRRITTMSVATIPQLDPKADAIGRRTFLSTRAQGLPPSARQRQHIDDQKRAETALRESEYKLRQIIETVPGLLWSADPDGELTQVNQRILDYVGKPFEDFKQGGRGAFIHPDDLPETEKDFSQAIQTGTSHEAVHRLRRADGKYRWHHTRAEPLRDQQGRTIQWYGLSVDIDEAKKAEDLLRRNRAYLAEAQQLSVTGSFGWCISNNLIVWSQEIYRILEIDPAVKPTLDLVFERTHPDDIEVMRRTIERLATEERDCDFEHRLLLPGGTVKQLHLRTHRVRFEGGKAEVVGAVMDVTAAREAEEALRRAQAELAHASRVATLGELSASIVHEVNQPLSSIVASGQAAIRWLDRDVPEKERARRAIVRLLSEAERAGQVIRRIRDLAKKAEPEMAQVDINGLVEEVVMLVHREAAGQRAAVRTQPASELPPVRGDRIQLQQVLINLAINGIQAMASVTDRARVLVIRTQRYGDDELLVAVEDAGVGIAPENLPRLFSAFYTTKPDGMGMGLSISRSIVEAHGGRLSATCNSGAGMTFQFTLSLYREQDAA